MSWKDRAIEADEVESNGSWKDRAIEDDSSVPARMEKLGSRMAGNTVSGGEKVLEGLGDFSLGAVDAATMGFGDEIGGGIMGAYESLMNDKNFQEEYKKYKQSIQDTQKEAEERSPWLHGIGELAGGAATFAGTAGLGLGLKAAQGAGRVAQIAKASGTGALLGGISGAGQSEGSLLEQPKQLAGDIAEGAFTGGIFGGALDAAGQVISPLAKKGAELANKYIEDSPILRQNLVQPVVTGWNKIPVGSEKWFKTEGKQLANRDTEDLIGKINEARNIIGSNITKSLDEASDKSIDVKSIMGENAPKFLDYINSSMGLDENTVVKKIANKIALGEEMSPREAHNLADALSKYGNKLRGPGLTGSEREMGSFSTELASKIKQEIGKKVPKYDDLRTAYYEFNKYIPETILKGDLPETASAKMLSELKDPATKLSEVTKKMFQEGGNLVKGDTPSLSSMQNTTRNLKDLQDMAAMAKEGGVELPDYLSHFGSPKELEQKISKSGDFHAMMDTLLHKEPHQGNITMGKAGLLGQLGSAAGAKLTQGLVHGGSIGKSVYNIPDVHLRNLATKMNVGPLKGISENLIKAIDNKNTTMKNAALFTALQHPEFRQFMLKENGE